VAPLFSCGCRCSECKLKNPAVTNKLSLSESNLNISCYPEIQVDTLALLSVNSAENISIVSSSESAGNFATTNDCHNEVVDVPENSSVLNPLMTSHITTYADDSTSNCIENIIVADEEPPAQTASPDVGNSALEMLSFDLDKLNDEEVEPYIRGNNLMYEDLVEGIIPSERDNKNFAIICKGTKYLDSQDIIHIA
jgi:hypothetical protein